MLKHNKNKLTSIWGKSLMGNNKLTCFLIVLFLLFIFAGVLPQSISAIENSVKKEVKQQKNPYANAEISIKIIPSINKTFGYDILVQGKQLIHQPNVPAMPGNEGFKTKKSAQKAAEFVVKKIRKNEMPPTVTTDDLNKIGVLK
jgi:hypothetical protein